MQHRFFGDMGPEMMGWMNGSMMWGMGIVWLLVLVLLVLAIAALLKYILRG